MSDFIKTFFFITYITIKHYLIGLPRPSWDLKFHLSLAIFKSSCGNNHTRTIEQDQSITSYPNPAPAGVIINEFKINNKYRNEAEVHIDKILKPYEHVLDTEWKDLKDDGITAEWI
ncbi:hypothetical protein RclHR1_00010028 [Rhizophagus clarus]|uniref:Alpha/beta hydrolase protein n=1 Tax=Rhizophagus clarus TaxID=94130 RepID=A0A2Z6QS82_9GLOM|nr:hypothetical protein RclHR1_00010028 [Rhizophagus clarus]GES75176.1 alpha/beta hydrolase protein [Rhizophagus clarus]